MKRILTMALALATVLTLFTFAGVGSFGATEVFSAYVGDVYENVYADSYSEYLSKAGSDTSGMRSWRGFAWKGDEALSRIDMFTRTEAFEDVTLVTEDFVTEAGDVIKAENIGFTYLDAVTINETMISSSKNGQKMFDVISGDTVRDMVKSTMYSAWVSMKVPEDAEAGIYNATLSVVSGDTVLAEFDYTLTVYDLVQPELDSVVDLWMWPYNSIRYYSGMTTEEYFDTETYSDSVDWEVLWNTHLDEEYFPALESELELYAKAGGDTIFAQVNEKNRTNGDPYPSLVKWTQKKDGSFEFDYTDFDKWVELNLKHGIDEQIKCYDIGQFTNWIVYYNESKNKVEARDFKAGDIYWNRFNGYFIEDFIKHLDEKGWFDITYIALDEKDYNITKAVVDLVKKYKNKDGKTLKVATAVASWSCEPLFDDIQDLSIAYGMMSAKMARIIEERDAKGYITTIYTCGPQGTSMMNDPGQSAESIHHTYKIGATGFLRWALQKYNADPYLSSYNYNEGLCSGDCYLIYPSKDISEMKSYSTPRYETLCEALRDIEKADYLEENIKELSSQVKNAFMGAQYAEDFRAVIDTYSAMLTSEGALPYLSLEQSEYALNAGDTVNAELSEEGVTVYEGQAKNTYIDDTAFTFSETGWTMEGHYFWLFLYSTNHYSNVNSASAIKELTYQFDFYGDSLEIYGSKGRGYGQATVTVDGKEVGTLDAYSPKDEKFGLQFSYDSLELGEHTVTVTGAGTKNSSASGYAMQVDYARAKVHEKIEWTTGNADVATVDEDGKVTAVGAGTTTLTAKCGDLFAIAAVTVKPDAAALKAKSDEIASIDLEGYPENVKADIEAALALSEKASTASEIETAYNALLSAEALTVSEIKLVNKPIVLTFPVGEFFTADGGRLELTRADGDKEYIFTATDMASGYDTSHAGTHTVTLTAYGKSVDYDITVVSETDATSVYKDVDVSWYESAVNYAVNHGLFNGVSGNTFEPNSAMNRAMLVTVLYRMEGSPSVAGLTNPFSDVAAGQWFTDPILWAADNGIVGGVGGGKFAPTDSLTREQLATILFRYSSGRGYDTSARGDLGAFPDSAKVSPWATDAYAWAIAEGLIGGNNVGGVAHLDPAGKATRAQVATILMRYQQNIVKNY